jgi:hypothetical protein
MALAAACSLLAGCGGGGGGTPNPPTVPLGTFKSATDRTTTSTAFTANVVGASASGTTVQIYGDERTGPATAFTSSHRLTFTLYGPVSAGSYAISTTHASGTAQAVYVETANQNGTYVTTGEWHATTGTIVVTTADGSHIQGTFSFNATNAASANVIHWTSGQFNVAYETPPPPQG